MTDNTNKAPITSGDAVKTYEMDQAIELLKNVAAIAINMLDADGKPKTGDTLNMAVKGVEAAYLAQRAGAADKPVFWYTVDDNGEPMKVTAFDIEAMQWKQKGMTVFSTASADAAPAGAVAVLRAVAEEAAQVLESAAAHNRSKGRTVFAHSQQDRADRLRAAIAATEVPPAPSQKASSVPDGLSAYDPNFKWGKQRVRLTLKQWDYSATLEAVVGGNCHGYEIFESAIDNVFEALPTRSYDAPEYAVAHVILTNAEGDTLEVEDDDLKFEDWLKPMVTSIEIIGQEPDSDEAPADASAEVKK